MYAVLLTFSDDPARLALRPAHREKLAALHRAGTCVMAGPWADQSGALLVLDAGSEDEVRELLADDPYYAAPGVTVAGIHEWNVVTGTS